MMATPFLIQQIPSNAKFVDQYNLVEAYPTGWKNDDSMDQFDMRQLLNEIQTVDPRIKAEELEGIQSPAPSVSSLFDVEDMQLSPRNFYWIFLGKHYWRGNLKCQWTAKRGGIYWLNCWATKTRSRILTMPSPFGSGAD